MVFVKRTTESCIPRATHCKLVAAWREILTLAASDYFICAVKATHLMRNQSRDFVRRIPLAVLVFELEKVKAAFFLDVALIFKVEVSSFLAGMTSLAGMFIQNEHVVYASAVVGGILMCKFVYKVSALISSQFKCYVKLNKEVKVEWNNRGFSTVHALFAAGASFYLVWLSDLFQGQSDHELMINSNSILSNSVLLVSMGYFLTDLGMILWHFPALGGKEYLLHHAVSMYAIFLTLIKGQGQIYILMVQFSEVTTPFVNLRWYLDTAGLKKSTIYVANGIFLFLGWLVARVVLFIYFFCHMYFHFDQVKIIFPLGFYSMIIVPSVLALMNLFWLWKILKGMMKTPSKSRHRN